MRNTAHTAGHSTSPVPGCTMCEQVFDPDRKVMTDTEQLVGYLSAVYPWASAPTSWPSAVGFLSRYVPLSEAAHAVMYERVANATADPGQVATDFKRRMK